MPGALEGLRVVDLTTGLGGPLATMTLSDHGADVVKVEPPSGDPQRSYVGSVVTNRGKRSVVLDLDRAADRDRMVELAGTADVLVESFAPGHMAARHLDYETLSGEFPGLVYCSLTGYPRATDSVSRPAIDLLVQARSGQQYEQPGFRPGPIFLYAPLPSIAASYLTVEGILAALYAREITGRGQWVETSLYQGVLAFTTQLWQNAEVKPDPWFEIGFEPQPSIYECADGLWVHSMHMAGGRGKDRSAIWRILGIDPPPAGLEPAPRAAHEVLVGQAIKRMGRQDLLEQFWANEIPIAPVRHAHEALHDEQVLNNGMSVEVTDSVHGIVRQAGISFRLHGAPSPSVQGPQPVLGQHTDEVLGSLAGTEQRARMARAAKRPLAHALEGVKVLDLGNFLAGPFGPMLLGDLGATVYKLESPEGDQMRPVTQPFNGCQRGKLDIVVDLKAPEGVEIAHRLIREVDVVHHNMRPGVAERLGVDYATAKQLNPAIIYCHTTMWGNDGPRASWPGFDQLGQASCGLELELGGDGNPPNWYRFGMCDQGCAVQSALAVLMALYWRERTGQGQMVDTSIVNAGVQFNTDAWIGPEGWSERPRSDQHQTGLGPLYRLYQTADGWVALACLGQSHWAALVKAVPDLQHDTRFVDAPGRRANGAAIAATLTGFFATRTAQDAFEHLDSAGVPIEIADPNIGKTWFDRPDLVAAGLVADYQHPQYGRFRQFGHLVHLSDTPGRIGGPPPLLGQHSRQILADLGYSPGEIDLLRDKGVTLWPASTVEVSS
jgi:crotonobetainyl-CoA:carnitine CoA-transferase CaiB-like acyl-CoA transferase